MWNDFKVYFELGLSHIADITAYDHIVFLIALCAIYTLSQWRNVLILVTAFTIGHCITLVLSGMKYVSFPAEIIEFLIPVTIFLTAIFNVASKSMSGAMLPKYTMALLFGLIHGLGFSNFFKSLLGKNTDIVFPLFSFNVGIETGQIFIVLILLLMGWIAMNILKMKQRSWNLFVSGIAAGIAMVLMMETKFW